MSRAITRCELTHLERQPIDLARARREHAAYEATLERLGGHVIRLAEEAELADSVFVEDTALVLDEIAVVLRPGAPSRRPEVETVAAALAPHREVLRLEGPGTVDGGDILRVGQQLFVGRSSRSDGGGIGELAQLVAPYGYGVREVAVSGCLHLKSAVTAVAEETLLVRRDWVDVAPFAGSRLVDVDGSEPFAANALRIGDALVYPADCPRTAQRLERLGLRVERVELGELAKAEGAVTCCSLILW